MTITSNVSSTTILCLPPEIHHLIIPYLPYPDALSLKHTSPYFYNLTDTGVRLKVAWLLDRKIRGLQCPERKCSLKTDAAFCASGAGEVKKIMERRRRHDECEVECEVFIGRQCGEKARKKRTAETWKGSKRSNRDLDSSLLSISFVLVLAIFVWYVKRLGAGSTPSLHPLA